MRTSRARSSTMGVWCAAGWADVIDRVLELAADEEAAHPRTKDEAATCLPTQHCPPHTDPVYDGVLKPLFQLAEEVPYSISIARIIDRP
ncbi:hypothetical protein [Streptomyces anthocyanicus]|uniref:hypothetical protein n=1 Tax=Streptomyces anthocyanicus TaxID=68174 RepID=UPI0037FC86D1